MRTSGLRYLQLRLRGHIWLLLIMATAGGSPVFAADDFRPLMGRWQRTDGGYVLEVRKASPDGTLAARYFNPRPINVARSKASMYKNYIKFELELRDLGYPGSAYTLVYDRPNDRLIGLYYHAVSRQNFDVVFVRMK